MRDEIILLQRFDDEYYDFGRLSLSTLNHVVPAIGDTLTEHIFETGVGICRVVDRFLSDFWSEEGQHTATTCWVLVIEQPDDYANHYFELDKIMRRIREADFGMVTMPNQFEALEELDYENRDPAYWTKPRKEILRKEREARLAAIKVGESRKEKE